MAAKVNGRPQVGSSAWVLEERASAKQIVDSEAEEFSFSARNEFEWLNEHMAEIFSNGHVNVADIFKTPGKLRGKTPRTARKNPVGGVRAPLSDVFSATPKGVKSPFTQTKMIRPMPKFRVAEDEPQPAQSVPSKEPVATTSDVQSPVSVPAAVPLPVSIQAPAQPKLGKFPVDSGYFGSQSQDATQPVEAQLNHFSQTTQVIWTDSTATQGRVSEVAVTHRESDERRTTEESFKSAKEEQTTRTVMGELPIEGAGEEPEVVVPSSPLEEARIRSPEIKYPETLLSPIARARSPLIQSTTVPAADEEDPDETDEAPSPSDRSSPIRPIVRKSSLNFASLPAREPLTTKKSIGNRISHADQSRVSYYGRATRERSLEAAKQDLENPESDKMDLDINAVDDMDLDEDTADTQIPTSDMKAKALHNKTSTQRLQDQISMLGQPHTSIRPPSKSIVGSTLPAPSTTQANPVTKTALLSPQRKELPVAPGAFPLDEDSWIGPSTTTQAEPQVVSPRPQLERAYSTDVMEGIHGQESIGGMNFNMQVAKSPVRQLAASKSTASIFGHHKSSSTSALASALQSPSKMNASLPALTKTISVSTLPGLSEEGSTAPKSPGKSFRGSPLKAAKDKFSSILKTSKGLFASGAAVSAEAKISTLSPLSKVTLQEGPSLEDVLLGKSADLAAPYPVIGKQPAGPSNPSIRKTRASVEREQKLRVEEAKESKEAVKEAKQAQRIDSQLDKAREKVREDARVYHMEQERVAAMERDVAARKEQERLAKPSQIEAPKSIRTSPRKPVKPGDEDMPDASAENTEINAGPTAMPPPAIPRAKTPIGRPGKRPLKPTKTTMLRVKPPTVIRVDTGSQRGHQFHPSNSTIAASLQDSLPPPAPSTSSQGSLRSKASTSSLQSKTSTSSFKSAASKALEAAARKKEQDELAMKRKLEAKQEMERQRNAIKEEEQRRQLEQQRRKDAERQQDAQREREAARLAEAKKLATRQAMEKKKLELEKAKEVRPPPPAPRPQQTIDAPMKMQEKALPSLPAQRADPIQAKPVPRMNSMLHTAPKAPPKRPLQQDAAEDAHARPPLQRNAPSYQQNEGQSKRRKTEEMFDADHDVSPQAKLTAPPIRQSGIRPKEMPTKSLFPNGYSNVSQQQPLQKPTIISQHNMNPSKPAHPMDMTQVSKAPISFVSASGQPSKTPARPGVPHNAGKSTGKSVAKSSPQYRNGDEIELPACNTDSEDDSDSGGGDFAALEWTRPSDLRKQLVRQETMDPADIFGQPGPLNLEEMFSKHKDRFHRFRARTSSANWSGVDRLTEDEIKKDLESRDKVRRQGGWTYDSMV